MRGFTIPDTPQLPYLEGVSGINSNLNSFNYAKFQCILLSHETAKLEAQLQYSNECPRDKYEAFFISISELFKLTQTFISESLWNEINGFLYPTDRLGQPQRDTLVNGVNIANKFLMELEQRGLNQIFEEPLEPAFMLEEEEENRDHPVSRRHWRHRRR